jgi:hypothetical protein
MIVPPVANPMATKPVPRRNALRLGAFAFIEVPPMLSSPHFGQRGVQTGGG